MFEIDRKAGTWKCIECGKTRKIAAKNFLTLKVLRRALVAQDAQDVMIDLIYGQSCWKHVFDMTVIINA